MPAESDTHNLFRSVAQHDAEALEGLLFSRVDNQEASGLDAKTYALVNIAALVAADANRPPTSGRSALPLSPASPPTRSSAFWWLSIQPSGTSE